MQILKVVMCHELHSNEDHAVPSTLFHSKAMNIACFHLLLLSFYFIILYFFVALFRILFHTNKFTQKIKYHVYIKLPNSFHLRRTKNIFFSFSFTFDNNYKNISREMMMSFIYRFVYLCLKHSVALYKIVWFFIRFSDLLFQ